jgi:hypothetical protein
VSRINHDICEIILHTEARKHLSDRSDAGASSPSEVIFRVLNMICEEKIAL